MDFLKRTVYKKIFLKDDVNELIHYYEKGDKKSLTSKYEAIHPRFYQDIFNEMVKNIPIEDALKFLNYQVILKSKEELSFSWEYNEEKRRELYQEIESKEEECAEAVDQNPGEDAVEESVPSNPTVEMHETDTKELHSPALSDQPSAKPKTTDETDEIGKLLFG